MFLNCFILTAKVKTLKNNLHFFNVNIKLFNHFLILRTFSKNNKYLVIIVSKIISKKKTILYYIIGYKFSLITTK